MWYGDREGRATSCMPRISTRGPEPSPVPAAIPPRGSIVLLHVVSTHASVCPSICRGSLRAHVRCVSLRCPPPLPPPQSSLVLSAREAATTAPTASTVASTVSATPTGTTTATNTKNSCPGETGTSSDPVSGSTWATIWASTHTQDRSARPEVSKIAGSGFAALPKQSAGSGVPMEVILHQVVHTPMSAPGWRDWTWVHTASRMSK